MKHLRFLWLCFIGLLVPFRVLAQTDPAFCPCLSDTERTRTLRLCFYNLENFFDDNDDPLKNDNAFTPDGQNHWTYFRYQQKADHLSKVFLSMGEGDVPDIIGVAEVENPEVIKRLLYTTGLKRYGYKYVHFESPDPRGVDVALFYRQDKFRLLCQEAVPVVFSEHPDSHTRDILYVKGIAKDSKDTLHLFVNHFTSRYGGYMATMSKRNQCARILRGRIDSILARQPRASIVAMGDFNDTPTDSSMRYYLKASVTEKVREGELLNLMAPYLKKNQVGTHKYRKNWAVLDQFIVTPFMTQPDASYRVVSPVCIFSQPFMLSDDEKYHGKKPFRTYSGPNYLGGYSDHLPILLDLAY